MLHRGIPHRFRLSLLLWHLDRCLGGAYADMPAGDRADNFQKAIDAYQAALRVTEKDFPAEWAMTQTNLGNEYLGFRTGDRAASLQRAIDAYQAALRVRTEKDFPAEWAWTQNSLGAAYSDLPTGDRAANFQKAIDAYQAALRVRDLVQTVERLGTLDNCRDDGTDLGAGSLQRTHFDQEIIILCVRWYITFKLSFRDLVQMMAERGITLSHTTILRWVQQYVPEFEKRWNHFARPVGDSWRVDETYLKIRGQWVYLYRAVDKHGRTVDFLLSKRRDVAAAKRLFSGATKQHGAPRVITLDGLKFAPEPPRPGFL
jgi:tetratricopeptide (TPR) repeat protein